MRVLGIEGTAWAACAAIFETSDPSTDDGSSTDAYQPERRYPPGRPPNTWVRRFPRSSRRPSHPRNEHERPAGPASPSTRWRSPAVGRLGPASASSGPPPAPSPSASTFPSSASTTWSPTSSRAPLLETPVCLNASGANAHILAYRNGRYRVVGETMDTGVGNAMDKFTRHVGWDHPGGPKVESHAKDGEYLDLPLRRQRDGLLLLGDHVRRQAGGGRRSPSRTSAAGWRDHLRDADRRSRSAPSR